MKTKLLLFLLLLIGTNTFAQYTNIPDANFEKKLIALGIDDVIDGQVLTSSINTLTSLDVSRSSITDLTGIQDFTALTILECQYNNFSTLDLSKNTLLSKLDCSNNSSLSLDVSKNVNLTYLDCTSNSIKTFDISSNIALEYLHCGNNGNRTNTFTVLDLSNNTNLKQLDVNYGFLSNLDLTKNIALEKLNCNRNNLSSLDLSVNTALITLVCKENNLLELKTTTNNQLKYLDCSNNKITSLDLSSNSNLLFLNCLSNNLVSLNLKNGNNANLLATAGIYFQYMNGNLGLDYSTSFIRNPNLYCILVDDVDYSNTNWATKKEAFAFYSPIDCSLVTQIPDPVFEDKLIALGIDTDGKNGVVSNTSIANITTLDVSNSAINDLKGIEGFTALTTLNCSGNLLKKLDLSKNAVFTNLDCSDNTALICIQVADIDYATANWTVNKDVTANFSLDCTIYTLIPDPKFEDKLIDLGIDKDGKNGKVATENISKLTTLEVSSSLITDLTGIQDFTSLTFLSCSSNLLTSLDVTKNIALTRLQCGSNKLTTLDISKNVDLNYLFCDYNQLTTLDVATNTNLIDLSCSSNQLNALDVSTNVTLKNLICNTNKLLSLNLKNGKNTLLVNLAIKTNPNLKCILVDDVAYSNTNWSTKKDATAFFSPYDCSTVTGIPDAKFEDKLIELGIDTDGKNGFITTASISSLTTLDVSNSSIENLTGIKDFTSLTTLDCTGNLLKKQIDLTNNVAITTLNCSNNPDLICIKVADIDVANNWNTTKDETASFNLDCTIYTLIPDSKFEDKLIALGIDKDGKNGKVITESIATIAYLDLSYSSITDLTGIQDFKALATFFCYNNQLTTLDVSKNVALAYLDCDTNQLTSLDVSKNLSLGNIQCRNNLLTSLDVSINTNLKSLDCSSNKLTSLNFKNGINASITSPYISFKYNPNLKCILVDDATYSNTYWADAKDATAIFNTDCTPSTLIPDSNFEDKLIALGIDTDGKNGRVITSSIASITTLEVYNSSISDLTGIEDFVSLTYLDCSGNALTALDVTKNTALTYLDCNTNSITALDLTQNTGLTDLYCNTNKLASLDVSNNLALNKLNCSENALTALDVSKNTSLTEFNCYNNSLTSLDLKNGNNANMLRMYFSNLAQNPDLKCIQVDNAAYCNNNWEAKDATAGYSSDCAALANTYTIIPDSNFEDKLIALGIDKDGKNNKVLSSSIFNVGTLDVSNSGIADLTGIEDFKMLTSLTCGNNVITTLDVSKNLSLDKLYCSVNKISSLDLAQNTALTVLSCSFNLLTTLDVSANKSLKQLECSHNSLTYLNIQNGNNANMQSMFFGNFTGNPELVCILVDDAAYSTDNWGLAKDAIASYNTVCLPYTLIPDSNFEDKLIAIGMDTDGKNGKVLTSSINTQIDLDVRGAGISDLTGIEDFTALKMLVCSDNLLTQINLSKNTALITLFCEKNELANLDVSHNANLNDLICYTNQLTSLDVSSNLLLTYLSCGLNQITSLDLSKNTKLTSLYCSDGSLTKLNVKNGNNTNITAFIATKNPNLSCIQVDDADYADSFEASFFKDGGAVYSTDCSTLGIAETVFDKIAIYPNPTKGELHIDNIVLEKATVYDALGKLVKTAAFTSGAKNNTIHLEGSPSGIYYIYLESEGANTAKKIIVE
jgi:Leucine-rich repeat (LRR) protein